jgi:hypothetical protein
MQTLFEEAIGLAVGGQRHHLETLRVAGHHIQGIDTD